MLTSKRLARGSWCVKGSCPTDDAAEAGFPVKVSDDYETVAGWLMDEFDCVPQLGDEFAKDGFTFKVRKVRRRRISELLVTKTEQALRARPRAARGEKEGHVGGQRGKFIAPTIRPLPACVPVLPRGSIWTPPPFAFSPRCSFLLRSALYPGICHAVARVAQACGDFPETLPCDAYAADGSPRRAF